MMLALTDKQILLIALLAALYVWSAFRVSAQMARIGRSRARWFLITLLLTAIPAAICLMINRFRYLWAKDDQPADQDVPADQDAETAQNVIRCPRCRKLFVPTGADDPSGVTTCPRCHQMIDPEHLA